MTTRKSYRMRANRINLQILLIKPIIDDDFDSYFVGRNSNLNGTTSHRDIGLRYALPYWYKAPLWPFIFIDHPTRGNTSYEVDTLLLSVSTFPLQFFRFQSPFPGLIDMGRLSLMSTSMRPRGRSRSPPGFIRMDDDVISDHFNQMLL